MASSMSIFLQQGLIFAVAYSCRWIAAKSGKVPRTGVFRNFVVMRREHVFFYVLTLCNLLVSFELFVLLTRPIFACEGFCRKLTRTIMMDAPAAVKLIRAPTAFVLLYVMLFLRVAWCYHRISSSATKSRLLDKQYVEALYGKSQYDCSKLYISSCDACAVKSSLHIHHGAYGCCYFFDHTCPWCANDICAANMLRFLKYLRSHCLFALVTAVWPVTYFIRAYQWNQLVLAENTKLLIPRAFRGRFRALLMLYSITGSADSRYLAYLLALQVYSLIMTGFQLCKQRYMSRFKYCYNDRKIIDYCMLMIRKQQLFVCLDSCGQLYLFKNCGCETKYYAIDSNGSVAQIERLSDYFALEILQREKEPRFALANHNLWALLQDSISFR